jgi:phosphoserine phosphatase
VKLLVLDVEGTLFKTSVRLAGTSIDSTIWQGIAQTLGPQAVEEEVRTHNRWQRGEYTSYLDWMKDTIRIHRRFGLTEKAFKNLISSAEYNDGVKQVLRTIPRDQYEPILVSGGFRELAERAQRDINIVHAFAACEYFFGSDGLLEAFNLLPCDFSGKIDFIQLMLREYGLKAADWIFIGDGANDVPIARIAPISVGYQAHIQLRDVCTHRIESFYELPSILEGSGDRTAGHGTQGAS